LEARLLGSGGWIPTRTRETCSAYLRDDRHVLLIDAGTGLQHLLEHPGLLEGVDRVDLVLTHFHLDHVVGLSYLPALPLQPVVWGPGELVAGASTRSILERLLGRPLFAAPLDSIAADVREITTHGVDLDAFELSVRVQERHTDPTLAFRVGDLLTYCTDTGPDPDTAHFAAGSGVLLHEAWHADASDDPFHTTSRAAALIARDAGVEHLVLIHVNPQLRSDSALLAPAVAEFPAAEIGVDLATIPVGLGF
jgi:ribonuclease BN (tRNA processing enzyme)